MKLPERWSVCAKWFVVWLVLLPMLLHRVEYSGVFSSGWVWSARWWWGLCSVCASRWWVMWHFSLARI